MIIEKRHVGAHGRKIVYAICAETCGRLHEIVSFDKLETAAIVLRYMNGGDMSEADERTAKAELKKADAPTDESKRIRKAS